MNFLRRLRPRPLVRRIGQIIHPEMLPESDGQNINGPSLIRVPDWVDSPLGRYYLYFAHHAGRYIRLAYADDLRGPWRVHPEGALKLSDCVGIRNHLASPDVHVDEALQNIRMYFHAPLVGQPGQHSFLANSSDGLNFSADPKPLGTFYFRVWEERGVYWALGKALLYRSETGRSDFDQGGYVSGPDGLVGDQASPGAIRHTAVLQHRGRTLVLFTRLGDRPERIFCAVLEDATKDWRHRRLGRKIEVLRPEEAWEGADLPLEEGRPGIQTDRQNAVRDPCIYREGGRTFLLYSVAGESGIALAELDIARLYRLL
jgi:hypothetical protein